MNQSENENDQSEHEKNRLKTCFFCQRRNGDRHLTKAETDYISKELLYEFEKYKNCLPTKTCSTCRHII